MIWVYGSFSPIRYPYNYFFQNPRVREHPTVRNVKTKTTLKRDYAKKAQVFVWMTARLGLSMLCKEVL